MEVSALLAISVVLRLGGTAYAVALLYRTGDRRFGFLTVMLALMATRQVWTAVGDASTGLAELPGLVVSVLAVATVHYLASYVGEMRRVKSRLRAANEELRRFQRGVEQAADAIFVTDIDGRIEYANPAFETLTGYAPSEAVGENPRILKSGEMDEAYYEEMWETILDGDVWESEIVNQRRLGEYYYAEQTVAPITDEDGDIEGFVAIQREVTERKERTQQLRLLDRLLRHNLRNELQVVQGYAEAIRDGTTGAPAERAEGILDEIALLLETADKERELVDILSASSGQAAVDVADVSRRVVDAAREAFPRANLTLEAPESAVANATDGLERSLTELVENAIVHSETGTPTVTVTVQRVDDRVRVAVADDGPGIPDQEISVLTGDRAIDSLNHGSGLGLWIVHWVVRRSEGTLTFAENEPRGSVVRIELPAAE